MDTLTKRQDWMAVLAKVPLNHLQQRVMDLGDLPRYTFLRSPETGLVMVRGRVGGTGQPFNLGEMTITRCVVQLVGSAVMGFGYVSGRSRHHAELAAVCDALMQCEDWCDRTQNQVITPLAVHLHHQRHHQNHQTAATRMHFSSSSLCQ